MNVTAQKLQSLYAPVGNHWHESTIERHSLSQPLRAASSLREGAGNEPYHTSHHPKTATFRAIFIAPTQLKRFGFLPFIGRHSLSQPFGLPAPSEREPGTGRTMHRTAQKPQHFGRFSSPLRNSKDLDFYHSSNDTPSVSPCGLPAPSEREPGWGLHHPSGDSLKSQISGDFHRPYENSENFTFHRITSQKRN